MLTSPTESAMWIARYLDINANRVLETSAQGDESAVRAQLQRPGVRLLSLRPAPGHRRHFDLFRGRPSDQARGAAQVSLLCRELQALTAAGLTVVEALDALAAQREGIAKSQPVYGQLLDRLKAGRPLSGAMDDLGGFPMLLVASVQASERTSNLGDALDAYLHYDEMVSTLARRVIGAALYPAIVVGLGALIALFLLAVVMPRFAVLYGQLGQDAAGITAMLLALSKALQEAPWLVPGVLATLVLFGTWAVTSGRWRLAGTWLVEHIPALAWQRRQFELARVYEALALLFKGGFAVHESLGLCQKLSLSASMRQATAAAQAAVEKGQSVGRSFLHAGMADAVTERLLHAGERGGDFSAVLHAVSRRHATAFETFVDRATRLVEPLLLLAVALIIGGMVVMLYMPIFDIASAVR